MVQSELSGKRKLVVEDAENSEVKHKRRRVCYKPLLRATVESGDAIGVRRLLDIGHDPTETYQGWTCLMKASEEGHENIMSIFLMLGMDLDAVFKKGRTALSFAASASSYRSSKIGALSLVLNVGADASRIDGQGYTAESRAVKERRWAAVECVKQERLKRLV